MTGVQTCALPIYYAGPTWEASDGSKVVGVVKAKVDAPDPRSIPWLLLETHGTGKAGMFAKVTSIQRVATVGGAIYSETPSDRMVILNGQVFHEGDKPAADTVLEQIRLKSAILNFRGQRYEVSF